MNMRICAAVAAAVALTTACGGEPVAAPPATTTTTTVAPPTPAELDQRAKAAIAPPGAFDAMGGKLKESVPANDSGPGAEGEIVTVVCSGSELRADDVSVSRTRIWAGQVSLFQRVHAMSERPAAGLLEAVRTRAGSCSRSRLADQMKVDIPIPAPQGVDGVYGVCEANRDPELVPWSCQAVMGRGTLISVVVASGQTQAAAEAQLSSVVPIFAETFVKA
ncbi:hypothetical protein OG205_02785 [Lentzea sp. NBC_00516]|uniref:hypothetical protein n=1 Tax=Lentzea sp. NBC_00516 TaxID=2903582 RepID=UPI002E80B975|nr:hypothetical protein [Lentzea sp. NBC_00516]WUD25948.1 hypothetical protein OG205_02785 [Lentzea sp. NBC_00516]